MKTICSLEKIGINSKSKILVIYPHPDDEAYFSAGFISKACKTGCELRLIVLTKGEASTLKFGMPPGLNLGTVRTLEMRNSAKTLGVKEKNLIIAEFSDGKLKQDYKKVTNFIKKSVSDFQPNFILTFEPYGIYGHPDHIITSEIITKICNKTGATLIYATVDSGFKPSAGAKKLAKDHQINKFKKIGPLKPNVELKLSIRESYIKIKSLKCHKSQISYKKHKIEKIIKMLKRLDEFFYI